MKTLARIPYLPPLESLAVKTVNLLGTSEPKEQLTLTHASCVLTDVIVLNQEPLSSLENEKQAVTIKPPSTRFTWLTVNRQAVRQATCSSRFPLPSVVVLSFIAAACWAAVWWNDRQVSRIMMNDQRPERLAQEWRLHEEQSRVSTP